MNFCTARAHNGYACCLYAGHAGWHKITNGDGSGFEFGPFVVHPETENLKAMTLGTSYELNRELDFEAAKKKWEGYVVDVAAQLIKTTKEMPKSCKNEYPPHICVLDEGHAGPHQAYKSPCPSKLGGLPLLMAEWHGGGLPSFPESVEATFRNDDQVDALKYAMGLPPKPEGDFDFLERMMTDAYRAIGISQLPKLADHPPAGITSGIALKAYYDAEIEKLTKQIQESHDKMLYPKGARQPAMGGKQETARPGVAYRIYDNIHRDDVLIVAESIENPGWGRMALVPGQVFTMWRRKANAPMGEVALTDDDLETAICQLSGRGSMHFQPWDPVTTDDDAEDLRVEYHETQEELFRTDPELMAHVAKSLDLDISNEDFGPRFGEKMRLGMDRAWVLAFETWDTIEHKAMVRAAKRTSLIMHNRRQKT